MTKINMTPGTDWTKETLVLVTNSGVEHCAVATDKRTANWVAVEQQWGGGAYAICDCGEYLSVKFYNVKGDFSHVSSFKHDVTSGEHIGLVRSIHTNYYWSYNHNDQANINLDTDLELRIYKDRSVVFLHEVMVGGKVIHYISTEPDVRYSAYNWNAENTEALLHNPAIHIVHDDDEIYALAYKLTKKEASSLHRMYGDDWSDLATRCIANYNSYDISHFHQSTQDIVAAFIDYDSDSNGYLRSTFEKEYGQKIKSVRELMAWCYLRSAATDQEDHAKLLLMGLEQYWNNSDAHRDEAIWARHNDDIILIVPNQKGTSNWGYGSDCKKLFAYNVKTKKRFYGECDKNGTWSFPIPALNYIIASMYLGKHEIYEYGQGERTIMTKTTIVGGISAAQLFDGSNVAWILNNTNGECLILDEDNYNHCYYHSDEKVKQKPVDIRQFLCDNRIGTIALAILVTTGVPMLEQLLKSKLFNMYFTALEDMSQNHRSSPEVFWDDDKKRSSDYYRSNSNFTYHGKEKNLKKMFGLSLNALREIDAQMEFAQIKDGYYYDGQLVWARPIPTMSGMAEALNADLSMLDPATFGRCLALCKPGMPHSHSRYVSRNSVWSIIGDTVKKAVGDSASPKQIVALLEHYTDCLQEYKDYLNMREQLINIQSVKPDIPDIFSEKRYPIKPGVAKRFIPFLDGMPDTSHPWCHQNFTQDGFANHYASVYEEAVSRGDFQVIKEGKNLLGVLIDMTPAENLKYLHDEASYWVTFYQDSAKDELFCKATQRVVPLEWRDDGMGLCIVAPKSVKDLKTEGSVLSHCVASYVDPIINGTENIMFLRRTDMPDSPFYTVEVLDSGEIRQVHCYANGDLTSNGQRTAFTRSNYQVYDHDYDIVKFLIAWSKAMKGKVKASSIKSAYGALCALR